jgi:hypothetical protein
MALRGLNSFQYFSVEDFIEGKTLVFVKATPWGEGEGNSKTLSGSKVLLQILQDNTRYKNPEINNFGEQFTVKVRDVAPSTFQNFKPLQTLVTIMDVERATIWGDFRNEISIIAVIQAVEVSK